MTDALLRPSPPGAPLAIPAGREAGPLLRRLFIAGGGTGGHLLPGLALAERALERFPGLEVTFFRTSRPIEAQVLAAVPSGVSLRRLELSPPGRGLFSSGRFLRQCVVAQARVRSEIRRSAPDALAALGGYPSLPGIIAALRERLPLILLEQNCVPGRVVRHLGRFAGAVACPEAAVPALRAISGRTRVIPTGIPLRRAVLAAAAARRERRESAGLTDPGTDSRRRTVLVVGGSQGARGLNRAVRDALPALGRFRERISWIHVAGDADKDDMALAYRKTGWEALVLAYAPDLPALLARSDLAITRAGGAIVAELSTIGIPAALVPYPHHRDRHQLHNALSLSRAGAARLIPEEDLGPAALAALFEEALFDDARRRSMEEAALSAARPEAADAVLDLLLELVPRPPPGPPADPGPGRASGRRVRRGRSP